MKYLPLSEQDKKLLLHLHRFIYLSFEFIDEYIYEFEVENNEKALDPQEIERVKRNKVKTNYRRLSTLERAGYITAFALPIKLGHRRPSNVYTLQKFGVDIVEQLTGIVHWNPKWSVQVPPWYPHTLSLAEVAKSYEEHAHAKNYEVKEWISEAKAHFKYYEKKNMGKELDPHVIRPDGIMVFGKPGKDNNIGVLMEMERSYADRKGIIRKIEQYNHFFDRTNEEKFAARMKKFDHEVGFEFPVKYWEIVFIGDNGSMGKRILRHLRDHQSIVPLKVASKEDLLKDPFGIVYRDLENPQELTTL
jgi:hypothetical protein